MSPPANLSLVTDETTAPAPRLKGATVLNEVHAFVTKYVVFASPEQADAVTLWILHSHAFEAAETTPRLSVQSAEKNSGKTRLMEVLELLVLEPLATASISAAAMFRLIAEGTTTLLVDEVDTVFSASGKGKEDLRGILNAGYRRGSCVTRVQGSGIEKYPVFAPVALAGIGRLPDTVQDRSIVIKLKRRTSTEPVTKLRRREVDPHAFTLRTTVRTWGKQNVASLSQDVPSVPDELGDRAADIWEPLLAIADSAGGDWPARARAAAIELSGKPAVDAETSATVSILADIRRVFGNLSGDRIATAALVRALRTVDDVRWGTLDDRELARLLKPFDISPKPVRDGEQVFRGYKLADFVDAFGRYV